MRRPAATRLIYRSIPSPRTSHCTRSTPRTKSPIPDPVRSPNRKRTTVTFDANGGTLSGNATVEVEEGKTIAGAPTAGKDGYTFDGWFDAATGGNKIDLSTYTVTKDVTLYAQYTRRRTGTGDLYRYVRRERRRA